MKNNNNNKIRTALITGKHPNQKKKLMVMLVGKKLKHMNIQTLKEISHQKMY